MFPKAKEYLEAKKTVKKYEKRQKQLAALEEELSNKLFLFDSFKFKINKKKKEIIFAGMKKEDNKTVIGVSKCESGDKFEPVIGKLLAVKNSLREDTKDIVSLVEKEYGDIVINYGDLYTGDLRIKN